MDYMFVNLKRFDIPQAMGGLCEYSDPYNWIRTIMKKSFNSEIICNSNIRLVYLLPESLIYPAVGVKKEFSNLNCDVDKISVGSQSVHSKDVEINGNFGAFTSMSPASAVKNFGAEWTIIGHSEERQGLMDILEIYEKQALQEKTSIKQVKEAISQILRGKVEAAINAGLKILFCVGEDVTEHEGDDLESLSAEVQAALREQLLNGIGSAMNMEIPIDVVIGYEPIWAIGPGKTPPGAAYITQVSEFIKETCKNKFNKELEVVYGGGVKEKNAKELGAISSLDGGLVALTKFEGKPAFQVEDLETIIELFRNSR